MKIFNKKTNEIVQKIHYYHIIPDLLILGFSFIFALNVRLANQPEISGFLETLLKYLPLFIFIKITLFLLTGVYNVIWRYLSFKDALYLIRSSVFASISVFLISIVFQLDRIPRSVFIIDCLFATLSILTLRVLRRFMFEREYSNPKGEATKRVLIYGASTKGIQLLKQIQIGSSKTSKVIGFIDDDDKKIGMRISGIQVLGSQNELSEILKQYSIDELILSFPSPTGEKIKNLLEICRPERVQIRFHNDSSQFRGDIRSVDRTRKIDLSDLLSRSSRVIEEKKISEMLSQKRVLVTGAGGSIGSELCRQILAYGPKQLLLLDNSELNLYQIDAELRAPTDEDGPVVPLMIDVKDKDSIERMFHYYKPEIVFHAAAYKHVHLVEKNPLNSILNNILGTYNVCDAALKNEVKHFVLISTDKAVNPVGLMGMTKRICEMIVTIIGRKSGHAFCSVRFGNVLGSSGSFVPLLTKQILNGDPVTVTHPDMKRFLMLIPEAVSLVLNAAVIGGPGDVLILKMGEPISIYDLAKTMIALLGRTEEEIPIVITGMRPGEKLYEEMYLNGDESDTHHPDIVIVPKGDSVPLEVTYEDLKKKIMTIIQKCNEGDLSAASLVKEWVLENAKHSRSN